MYITKIELNDIRCFKNLTIDLKKHKNITKWLILVGDNGQGKTALLRSIGIGLCDQASASGLLKEIHGRFIRKGQTSGSIKITLEDKNIKYVNLITITADKNNHLESLKKKTTKIRQGKISTSDLPWEKLFAVGYGAGRGLQGTESYERYSVIDAIYNLYRYDSSLQNPELAWRRLLHFFVNPLKKYHDLASTLPKKSQNRFEHFFNRVNFYKSFKFTTSAYDHLLVLLTPSLKKQFKLLNETYFRISPKGFDYIFEPRPETIESVANILRDVMGLSADSSISLERNGIYIDGYPLKSVGDGYQSVLTWILDLLSWRILINRKFNPKEIEGIVIIDELEQHLHPKWQRIIIDRLSNNFPKLQFIVSTHSPLCAAGSEGISEDEGKIILISKNDKGISEKIEDLPVLSGMSSDQILSSKVFGYLVSSNVGAERILREGSFLADKGSKRTKSEGQRYKKIKETIKKMMLSKRKTIIEEEVADELNKETRDEIKKLEKELFEDPRK